jgi:hypothetical protein
MIQNPSLKNNYTILFQNEIAEVRKQETIHHHSLHALQAYNTGDIIAPFIARDILNKPNYLTVQTGENTHILLQPEYLQYVNHSCNPNCFFNTDTMELECIQPICINDEFTFFYPSTEWYMEQSFVCHCASHNCNVLIQGAYFLPPEVISNYKVTNFIQSKLKHIDL